MRNAMRSVECTLWETKKSAPRHKSNQLFSIGHLYANRKLSRQKVLQEVY